MVVHAYGFLNSVGTPSEVRLFTLSRSRVKGPILPCESSAYANVSCPRCGSWEKAIALCESYSVNMPSKLEPPGPPCTHRITGSVDGERSLSTNQSATPTGSTTVEPASQSRSLRRSGTLQVRHPSTHASEQVCTSAGWRLGRLTVHVSPAIQRNKTGVVLGRELPFPAGQLFDPVLSDGCSSSARHAEKQRGGESDG